MQKALSIGLAGLLVCVAPSLIFAEEGAMHKKIGEGGMMKHGKMAGMCPTHRMMMKNATEKTLAATQDGGVVVMVGNKLFKYDKNLELKKEAEVKLDVERMQEKTMKQMESCPRCRKMKEMCEVKDKTAEKLEESTESQETSD